MENIFIGGREHGNFDYYFDIIDVSKIRYNRDVAQLAIREIGNRPLVLEDKSSNCLFAKDTALDLNFISDNNNTIDKIQESIDHGEEFVVVSADIYEHLALGEVKRPASEYVRSILHEYLGYNNSINITGVPLYHLDVNRRISVEDDASDIHGDYII